MYTISELYGKEAFLDQRRKGVMDASSRNRLLHPSRLGNRILPENKERFHILVYRFAYVLLLAFIITLLAAEVVTAVSGEWIGGGGNENYLVR